MTLQELTIKVRMNVDETKKSFSKIEAQAQRTSAKVAKSTSSQLTSGLSAGLKKIGNLIKTATIWKLVGNIINKLVSKLKDAMPEDIKAKFEVVDAQLTEAAKNLLVALSPIIKQVVSVLQTLSIKITELTAAVAGETKYTVVTGVETKKLARELASFDTLETIGQKDSQDESAYITETREVSQSMQTIGGAIAKIVDFVEELGNFLSDAFGDTFSKLIDNIAGFIDDPSWSSFKKIFIDLGTDIVNGVSKAIEKLGTESWLGKFMNFLKELAKLLTLRQSWSEFEENIERIFAPDAGKLGMDPNTFVPSVSGTNKNSPYSTEYKQKQLEELMKKSGLGGVFANAAGGVYTAPTLGLVGEYAGAQSNPEIISPQSIMRETMEEANGGVISTLIQCNRQLIQAINNKEMTVAIGDSEIGSAASRNNNAMYYMTGEGAMA